MSNKNNDDEVNYGEEGWLETSMNWCPSLLPADFNNTILFGEGSNWKGVVLRDTDGHIIGCTDRDDAEFILDDGTVVPKAYCHYSISKIDEDDGGPYFLFLSGGDDSEVFKEYEEADGPFKDLAKLKEKPVSHKDIELLRFIHV